MVLHSTPARPGELPALPEDRISLMTRKPPKSHSSPATADWAPFKSIFDELEGFLPADVQALYQACMTADGETIDQALDAHLQAHGEPEQQALAQLGDPLDAAGDHRKHKRPANVDPTKHGLSREAGMAVYLAEHMKWNRP